MMQGRAFRLIPRCVVEQANGKRKERRPQPVGPLLGAEASSARGGCSSSDGPRWVEDPNPEESGGEDWPKAYRHSPISEDESRGCIVAWYHQEKQGPVFQHYHALLFGLPLAVTSFNRYSRLMEALGRRLTYTLASMYFDDAKFIDWASSKGSSQWALEALSGHTLCRGEAAGDAAHRYIPRPGPRFDESLETKLGVLLG